MNRGHPSYNLKTAKYLIGAFPATLQSHETRRPRPSAGVWLRATHPLDCSWLIMATSTQQKTPLLEGQNVEKKDDGTGRVKTGRDDLSIFPLPQEDELVHTSELTQASLNASSQVNGQCDANSADETLLTPDITASHLCEVHRQGASFFCEDCNKLVCSACVRENHRDHSCEEASSLLPDHIAELQELLEPARDLVSQAEIALRQLEQDDKAIESNRELCTENIREVFNGLRAALDEREKLLLDTIHRYIDAKLHLVRKQRGKLSEGQEEVKAAIESIERLEQRKSDVLVLQEEQLLMDKLDFQQECILGAKNETQLSMYSSTYIGFREDNVKSTAKAFDRVIALCELFPDADSGYYCSRDIIIEQENPYMEVSHKGYACSSRVRFQPSFRTYTRRKSVSARPSPFRKISASGIPAQQPSHSFRRQSVSSVASFVSSYSSDSEESSEGDEPPPLPPIRFGSLIAPSPVIKPVRVYDRLSRSKAESVFPCGVGVIMNDTLVISDVKNNCLRLLASNGKFIDTIGGEGKGSGEFEDPCGIAIDRKQQILVAQKENPRVQRFTPSGKCIRKIAQRSIKGNMMGEPWAIAISPGDGSIYVSDWDKGCIHVFQASGKFLHSLGLDRDSDLGNALRHPAGLTFNLQGLLLVVDRGNHCVWMLKEDGAIQGKFGGKGHRPGDLYFPYGIAVDPYTGSLIVTESGNNRISIFSSTGEFLRSFGQKGAEVGMFDHPRHVCVNSRNELIVADEVNQRLQVFALTSE